MDSINLIRKKMIASGRTFEISVSGNSMEPMIQDGDTIAIKHVPNYEVGDVVVFVYDHNILVHRILKIENDNIFCKGDNSFRLEQVPLNEVMGKVDMVNGIKVGLFPRKLIRLSYRIGKIFEKNKNVEMTRNKFQYKKYKKIIGKLFRDNIREEEN